MIPRSLLRGGFIDLIAKLSTSNKSITAHNIMVRAKINNPFVELEYNETIRLGQSIDDVNLVLQALEKELENHNRAIEDRETLQKELLILNDIIASHDIRKNYENYKTQQETKNAALKKLSGMNEELRILNDAKSQLDAQRRSTHIAVEEINKSLEYIFFCKEHLSLRLGEDGLYHLNTNGNPVNPNRISCGERNALALCYFFIEIARNTAARNAYSSELLLVIDDPVSSFDMENRIGIISFLRLKLDQILKNCKTTKILIMTHDVSVMYDLQKAINEISTDCKSENKAANVTSLRLHNKTLSEFTYKQNEYAQLLQMVYEYAKGPEDEEDLDLVIGNVMRRALEAFSFFSFKLGIDKVSLDRAVLNQLPNNEYQDYFQNLMYRLVLNNESHFEENLKGSPEVSWFSHLSTADKQRTAKDVLCFIYLLNDLHLLSHLPTAKDDLETWCSQI